MVLNKKTISKDEINQLPLWSYDGEVVVVESLLEEQQAVEYIKTHKILGVDTETRPSFKKGQNYLPSILQIATSEKVYIFYLSKYSLGKDLISIFENENYIKAGIALSDDCKYLQKICSFNAKSIINIEVLAKKYTVHSGLRNLAALFLGLRVSKTEQCSNWSNYPLSASQIRYAATDAWISRQLYVSIVNFNH